MAITARWSIKHLDEDQMMFIIKSLKDGEAGKKLNVKETGKFKVYEEAKANNEPFFDSLIAQFRYGFKAITMNCYSSKQGFTLYCENIKPDVALGALFTGKELQDMKNHIE